MFIENFLVYGVGGIISKIIPLIMVPVITRLMPDSAYFGISDLSTTIVNFGSAIAMLGMYDAMYRYFFERDGEQYKKSVCSTAFIFTVLTSCVVFASMLFARNKIAKFIFADEQYAYLVCISAVAVLVSATNGIVSAPTRMQNKRKIFLVTNTLSPILAYTIAVLLILQGAYTVALPIAMVISGLIMEIIFAVMNRAWFHKKFFDKSLLKPLLYVGLPIVPNFLIFWIFNSCDKIMITNLLGVSAAGVYSVSAKLGHLSQLIYTAFAGGWQYFAFSVMNDDNQTTINSKIFEYLGVLSFLATIFLCAFSYMIFKIIFPEQYLNGYIVAPYLFLAPLLQMLFQVIGNQFLIIKKTWPSMLILSFGAVVNILINYLLIPILGIEGASLATLFGYTIAVIICSLTLIKMKLMILNRRFMVAVVCIVGYLVLWRLVFNADTLVGILAAVVVTFAYALLYKDELIKIKMAVIRQKNKINKS